MLTRRHGVAYIVVWLLIGTLLIVTVPVRAQRITMSLYGSAANGWGLSPGTESIPGPTITVAAGDIVTIDLFSTDGHMHQFFIDYNGNGAPDPGEPTSALFNTMTTLTFTASVAGTFTYFCAVHPMTMHGTWITSPGADLVSRRAWPSAHHLSLSSGGPTETFFARVENTGPIQVTAIVVFTVTSSGGSVTTVQTSPATIPVGGRMVLDATWAASIGSFSVTAVCKFETVPNGPFDGTGPTTKTFSFTVVS